MSIVVVVVVLSKNMGTSYALGCGMQGDDGGSRATVGAAAWDEMGRLPAYAAVFIASTR
ncbi:MAG: hypothetical protein KUG77_17935 [Nannocystaceae bacterium]|nr:hypothetical protein [Nannocystaceae bacterium]